MGLLMTCNLVKEDFVAELVEAGLDEKCVWRRRFFGALSPACVSRRACAGSLTRRARRRYMKEAAEALYEKAMQFCSHELPVRRGVASCRCKLESAHTCLLSLVRAQTKAEKTEGQTGSMATFMNGKLCTKPLKARRAPSCALRRALPCAHAARPRLLSPPFFALPFCDPRTHASRPPRLPPHRLLVVSPLPPLTCHAHRRATCLASAPRAWPGWLTKVWIQR
jgi:hypothetical protein